ncbi:MAG: hypothetical protein EOO38_11500 [Cytophagaceae bacterium]|nr:MAG: hypothetical protein EOO38_11500 [Cytophagaceae bacterium]
MTEFEHDVLVMIIHRDEYSLSEQERNDLVDQVGKLTQNISSRVHLSGWSHGRKAAIVQVALTQKTENVLVMQKATVVPPALSSTSLIHSDRALLADMLKAFAPSLQIARHRSLANACEKFIASVATRFYSSGWHKGFDGLATVQVSNSSG